MEETQAKQLAQVEAQKLKIQIADLDTKLEKLLNLYLADALSTAEFAAKKNKIMSEKVTLTEKITDIEQRSVSWLEPARAFVKSLNHTTELVRSGDKSEMTTFLKQIGSNHILFDKSVSFSPKIQYKLAAERSEADNSRLQNPFWRRNHILCANLFRAELTAHAPRA